MGVFTLKYPGIHDIGRANLCGAGTRAAPAARPADYSVRRARRGRRLPWCLCARRRRLADPPVAVHRYTMSVVMPTNNTISGWIINFVVLGFWDNNIKLVLQKG